MGAEREHPDADGRERNDCERLRRVSSGETEGTSADEDDDETTNSEREK